VARRLRRTFDHDAFISHSSANRRRAAKLREGLTEDGLSIWLDSSDIRFGSLLGRQLQEAIGGSGTVLLLWSDKASASPWVTVEWLSAIQLDRVIIPCVLDATSLPQCLSTALYVDLRRSSPVALEALGRQLRDPAPEGTALTPFARAEEPKLAAAISAISRSQYEVLDLVPRDPRAADRQQRKVARSLAEARSRWPLDSELLNLAGYQAKNDYLLQHWGAVQAGRWPSSDPHLVESRQRFFEGLSIDPTNTWALNGLANTLLFQREFDAAAFFNRAAITAARTQGIANGAAQEDAELISRFVR
jgi:hypothetical protein